MGDIVEIYVMLECDWIECVVFVYLVVGGLIYLCLIGWFVGWWVWLVGLLYYDWLGGVICGY